MKITNTATSVFCALPIELIDILDTVKWAYLLAYLDAALLSTSLVYRSCAFALSDRVRLSNPSLITGTSTFGNFQKHQRAVLQATIFFGREEACEFILLKRNGGYSRTRNTKNNSTDHEKR